MTADPQNRLAARCRACGEVFWTPGAAVPSNVPCPACEQPVPVPSGRFDGIRNLVAYAMQLGHARLERLEQTLTWSEGHLPGKPGDDEFVPLRRALNGLDMASALFWRQSLLTALNEVSKEPHVEMTEERVTAIARRVVQLVMSNRSYEPRAY